jgi:hypothetical protein
MACGREPGGIRADQEGICPAAQNSRYQGINGGQASGRFCWTEPDTNCKKFLEESDGGCMLCSFFTRVLHEEGEGMIMTRSAIIGTNQRPDATQDQCEFMDRCQFLYEDNHISDTEKQGWITLFCRKHSGSQHCERKIIWQSTGDPPPKYLTPTGILREPTST